MGRARHPMKLYFTGSHCYGLKDDPLKTEEQVPAENCKLSIYEMVDPRAELCELTQLRRVCETPNPIAAIQTGSHSKECIKLLTSHKKIKSRNTIVSVHFCFIIIFLSRCTKFCSLKQLHS